MSIRRWWRQPDHYDWFSSYLHVRGMARMTRVVLAVVSASLACLPMAMLWGSAAPHATTGRVLSVLAGFGGGDGHVLVGWLRLTIGSAATASGTWDRTTTTRSLP